MASHSPEHIHWPMVILENVDCWTGIPLVQISISEAAFFQHLFSLVTKRKHLHLQYKLIVMTQTCVTVNNLIFLLVFLSPDPMLRWQANDDVAADDALGKKGKDASCWACWDLRPNGARLIAGKSSFWQAASHCMLEPAATASHLFPLLTHTVRAHTHTHTHAHTDKLKSECTERGLIIWQGWGVRSHFQPQWCLPPSKPINPLQESARVSELWSLMHGVFTRQEGDWRITNLA